MPRKHMARQDTASHSTEARVMSADVAHVYEVLLAEINALRQTAGLPLRTAEDLHQIRQRRAPSPPAKDA